MSNFDNDFPPQQPYGEQPYQPQDMPQGQPYVPQNGYTGRSPQRGRYVQPHRGVTILVLGILGIVCCAILGIVAWVMGSSDLDAMRAGRMDKSGRDLTQAGRVCGIIATFLWIAAILFNIMAYASHR